MAQTLDEFLNEERERLAKFEAYWRASNRVAPVAFPMSMESGNEGLWSEAWMGYNASDAPPKPGEYEPVPEGYVPESPDEATALQAAAQPAPIAPVASAPSRRRR